MKPAQESYIRADALRLYRIYIERDLAHDAHGIWELAGDCLRCLTNKYEQHPLAVNYAVKLVEHFSGRWYTAHQAA